MANDKVNFYYDAQRQGYDTVNWRTLSGVPTTTGNGIRMNNAEAIHYGDILKGRIIFNVTIPVAPASGQSKRWGLAQKKLGSYLGFRINGSTFQVEAINGLGQTETEDITWRSAWTAAEIRCEIFWTGFSAEFRINDERITTLNGSTVSWSNVIPKYPLSLYLLNSNTDAMECAWIEARNLHYYYFNGNTNSATFVMPNVSVNEVITVTDSVDPEDVLSMNVNDAKTIGELVTMGISDSDVSVNDTETITESVDAFMMYVLSVNDTETITEDLVIARDPELSVSDQLTITESTTASI